MYNPHRKTVTLTSVLFITFTLMLFQLSESYVTMDAVDRLLTEKKVGYNLQIRPKFNQSQPLVISMAFDLIAIRDFDEVAEKFSVVGTVYMIWKDDRMVWDPRNYSNLYTLIVERRDFWAPPFILVNAFEKFEKVGDDPFWPIRFYYTGDVLYHPGQVFTTTCSVDVELYPWDIQTCEMLFTVWGHIQEEIDLRAYDDMDKVSLTYFGSNGEWDLLDTEAKRLLFNLFSFRFVIKRKPLFIVVNTIIPIIFMSVLNILAFLIPIESGERISYSITVLLAIAVFLTLISDSMPKSGTTVAVLCYYLVCVLALSMAIILTSVLSMMCYYKNKKDRVPACLSALVKCVRCRFCRTKRKPTTKSGKKRPSTSESQRNNDYRVYRGNSEHSGYASNGNIGRVGNGYIGPVGNLPPYQISYITRMKHAPWAEHYMAISEKTSESQRRKVHSESNSDVTDNITDESDDVTESVTWQDVSAVLDIVFGVFSVVCLAGFTATFFIYTLTSSKYD